MQIHESPVHAVLNYVSSNKVCSCWLISLVFLGPSFPLFLILVLSPLLRGSLNSEGFVGDIPFRIESKRFLTLCNIWQWDFICSHILQEEASLMMSEQGTDLWGEQNIIRSHLSLHFFLFFLRSIIFTQVYGLSNCRFYPKQCWLWISSGVDLKLNYILVGCSYKPCATITLAYPAVKMLL